tara:strand:+ start:1622 stop:1750 length:129 start_codon:yes stop_codon:yes gene_type:complete
MKETKRIFVFLDENGRAYPPAEKKSAPKKKAPAKKKAAKKDE